MSSGHYFDDDPGSYHELRALRREYPAIGDWMRRYRRVDRGFSIPYLGGISTDGATVYVDEHLPALLANVSVDQMFIVHECIENAIIRVAHMGYEPAHHLATAAEAEILRIVAPHVSWRAWRDELRPYFKPIEHEELDRIPMDLALYPYSGRLHKALWDLQHGKISKISAGYRIGTSATRCGTCSMFRPMQRTCSLVIDTILAWDTCDRWEPMQDAEEGRQTAMGQGL